MSKFLKIYIRDVYWKSINITTDKNYFDIFVYHQDYLQEESSPADDIGHDLVRVGIQKRVEQVVDPFCDNAPYMKVEYFCEIFDPDIVIWNTEELRRVKFHKIQPYDAHPNRELERFEILDL